MRAASVTQWHCICTGCCCIIWGHFEADGVSLMGLTCLPCSLVTAAAAARVLAVPRDGVGGGRQHECGAACEAALDAFSIDNILNKVDGLAVAQGHLQFKQSLIAL
jgi:hypothetical protein